MTHTQVTTGNFRRARDNMSYLDSYFRLVYHDRPIGIRLLTIDRAVTIDNQSVRAAAR